MEIKKILILLGITFVVAGCGNTKDTSSNSSNNDTTEEVHIHTFEDKWTFNETNHWHASTCGHDVTSEYGVHVFNLETVRDQTTLSNEQTCTEPARYYKTCMCGAVSTNSEDIYEVGEPKGHTYSNDWTANETEHWHAATCGHIDQKKDLAPHNLGDDYYVSADGNKHYQQCTICGYKTSLENHVLTSWVNVKSPTINEAGERYAYCDVCNEKVTEKLSKVYSSVSEVNTLIQKIGSISTIKMLDGSLIEETKAAYNNLSAADKALVNNYSTLENAFTTWEDQYSMVYDPLLNGAPEIDGYTTTIGTDSKYGTILKINVAPTSDTTQFCFNINSETYNKDSILHIFIRSPFIATGNTSQSAWFGEHDRDNLFTLVPNGWTEISKTGKELSATGNNATQLNEAISLQRYINGATEEYSGEYYLASIIAEKRANEEGSVVIPVVSENIDLVNTWGGDSSTVTNSLDETYGKGVELNITSISGAYEIKINGVDKSKANIFDYVYCYVYAPISSKFYFSQKYWRNNVMTVDVAPDDATNGTVANGQAHYQAGWNKISIPTAYLPNATYMFFEIYTPAALGKWVITDFYGGYTSKYISNAATRTCGLSSLNSSQGQFDGTFTKGKDDIYGSYDEITINNLSRCNWGPTITVGGETVARDNQYLRFYVYSPLDFPINMAIYGNGWYSSIFADGHMFNTCLFPKEWNEIIITTNCYNETDKAYRKFDFSNMTIFFEDIKKTTNIVLDGLKISSFELFDSYPEDAKTSLTYDINENAMYVLGTSNTGNQQMMGFVLTYNQKVIVVDGGKRNEYRQLKNILTALGGHVDYQIFTHAHNDHYGTYLEMYNDPDITVDTLVYNFSSWDNIEQYVPLEEDKVITRQFQVAIEAFTGNVITCGKGTTIAFDDFVLEFLNNRYEITGDVNEASMCFKVTTPNNSVLFLGDLSSNNAPKLLNEYKDNLFMLQANYLQLAHHGQRGGSKELYEAVNPNYAIWCTTVRNYNNWTVNGINTGALKSAETKDWLKSMNVTDVCPFYRTIKVQL